MPKSVNNSRRVITMNRSKGRNIFYVILFVFILFWSLCSINAFADTIIDNGDSGTSFTGAWRVSGGANPWDSADPLATSLWSRDGDTYTWTFTPTDSGYHDFSMWWTEWPSRSDSVPVMIRYWGGTDTLLINQKQVGGQWNLLTTYPFEAGASYDITVTAQPGPTSTSADAVKFVYQLDINVSPVATIESISPNPALTDAVITFKGHGDDIDGGITGWSWASSLVGQLSSDATSSEIEFTTTLSEGIHTISFTVVDDDGAESEPVTQTLIVQDTINEVIIDNGDSETSFTGSWSVSGGADPWDPDDPSATSLWSRDGDTYTWTFTPPISGTYEFSMWWTQFSSRGTNIPVSIEFLGGTDTVPINQQAKGGQWNVINTYPFEAGVSYDITITSQPGPSSTCADAVRFVFAPVSTHTITATAGANGTITPIGEVTVNEGDNQEFNISPDTGYHVAEVLVDGSTVGAVATYTFTNVTADHTIAASFEADSVPTHTITATAGANGTITPSGEVTVNEGDDQVFNISPDTGYHIAEVLVDGLSVGAVASYTFTNVTDNHTIAASFEADPVPTHTITATAGANGTITPSGEVTVNEGDDQVFNISPDTGYHIAEVLVDGLSVGAVASYTFTNVTDNHTITASFEADSVPTHTITATAGANGTITPSGEVTVNEGDDQVFNISPDTGYHVAEVLVDGLSVGAVASYTFTNVTDNHTIAASFEADPVPTYTITATAGANGTIAPSGEVTVNEGDDQVFNISPDTGYHIAEVLVDGLSVGAVASYTFTNVTDNHTIAASFEADLGSVIIDNGDPETSYTGTWAVSSASGWYGTNSVWSRDGSIYRWTFSPSVSGYYDVGMWWTTWSSRSTNVPVIIEHAAGSTEVDINQQLNGSQWNSIGAFNFEAGVSYDITITSQPGPSSTCADAVRMTAVPPPSPPEQIFVFPGYASVDATEDVSSLLQDLGAIEDNGVWEYRNGAQNKNFEIRFGNSIEEMRQAFMTEDAHVLYFGHSNYGLGALFATANEFHDQLIDDIQYIDDDRIFNYSSKWVHVSVRGMRTGQAYPTWWPIFKDGSSGILPYDFGDGDPAYNYYITYQVLGDPTHHKIENVRHGAIERFPDWSGPAWYSPDGIEPVASNPDDQQYFITNPTPWKPSVEVVGDWRQSQTYPGYYLENYVYSFAGQGDDQMRWMFDIPTAGYYKIKAWWAASQTRSNNAPYTVYHSNPITFDNVSTTIQVNQRLNGEQWNELGEFFFDIGEYSVILTDDTTTGNVVGDAIRLEHVDNPPEVLSADFNARVRSGVAPLEVTFDSENVGEVSALFWDFGDGDTNSTRDYITHIYDQPGTYTVSFTVYGPLGSDTVTKTDYIVVGADSNPGPILRAEFRAISAQEGLAPFEARFGDRSSGDIVSWLWYFGDGYTSEEQNPTHIYETTGNYTATLTVIDSDGSTSTETKPNFIRVSLFDKTIDNVDYPKTHYRSKTLLFVNDLDIDPNDFKYSRLLYVGCDSGHYFTDTFKRGKMFYSLNTSSTGPLPLLVYLRSYLEGKKDYEVWQDLQSLDPIFDYYYFDRPPFEQPVD
jgi:PKD repeat protein